MTEQDDQRERGTWYLMEIWDSLLEERQYKQGVAF